MNLPLFLGAILAAIGVGIGALGAHAMPGYLETKGLEPAKVEKRVEQCETAVRYQLIHSLAIVTLAGSSAFPRSWGVRWGTWLMVLGVVLFSGGIYGIVFLEAGTHWIVPFGGLSMIAGWLAVAIAAFRGSGAS